MNLSITNHELFLWHRQRSATMANGHDDVESHRSGASNCRFNSEDHWTRLLQNAAHRDEALAELLHICNGKPPTAEQLTDVACEVLGEEVNRELVLESCTTVLKEHPAVLTQEGLTDVYNALIDVLKSQQAFLGSVITIQKKMRSVLIGHKVLEAIRFAAWDSLDAWEELELLRLGSFLVEVTDGEDLDSRESSVLVAEPKPEGSQHTACAIDDVLALISLLQDGGLLRTDQLCKLLNKQAALLRQLPNVQYINLQPGQKLTVVGDLHGQLADLLHIFRINGWPSATNLYLFNGDFVDRGEQSVEVVTVLFAWQQKLPKSVFLNRGNHEDSAINAAYGFLNECCTKYNRLVYKLFDSCFSWLPLATVVDHTTLVVHAGIDDHTSIADIAEVDRSVYTMRSAMPPSSPAKPRRSSFGRHPNAPSAREDVESEGLSAEAIRVISPLLWSDPRGTGGCTFNARRGAGSTFGAASAKDFLMRESLQLLIRSHECVPDGYSYPFPTKSVMTVFSASNYAGRTRNKGALAVLHYDHVATPEIITYTATEVTNDEIDLKNLQLIQQLILEKKMQLREAMQEADRNDDGRLSVQTWADVMQETLRLRLPWGLLQPMLAPIDDTGRVRWQVFLEQYEWRTKNESAHAEALLAYRAKLVILFERHQDASGNISYSRLKRLCSLMSYRHPQHRQLFDDPNAFLGLLGVKLDANNCIKMETLLEAFRVRAQSRVKATGQVSWSWKGSDIKSSTKRK